MEKIKRIFSLALCLVLVVLMLPAPAANAAPSQAEVDEKIRWIIASIPDDCDTEYEKALWLHDYLCKTVTYKTPLGDEAYTALIDGVADCGGYADAYMRLLHAVGILAGNITGGAATGSHAWNIVILDNKCYFTDVCWDDLDNQYELRHTYFMISYEEMGKDHWATRVLNGTVYGLDLPTECNHNDLTYRYKDTGKPGSGHFNNSTTAEEAAKHFKVTKIEGTTVTLRCDYQFDGSTANWVSANEYQIGQLLGGVSRVLSTYDNYGIMVYERNDTSMIATQSISFSQPTVRLSDSNKRQQLSVNFSPANASYQDVTYTSSDSRIAKVDENGVVRALAAGTATITATTVDGKTATCQVVVEHQHSIRAVAATAANCITHGNKAHYICNGCGTLFSDSKGNTVVDLSDVMIWRTGYCATSDREVKYNDEGHWTVCRRCGKWCVTQILPHDDWDGDGICNGMNNSTPCGYVMNPSATKPTTKPTQPSTKPPQSTTAPSTNPPATTTPVAPPATESTPGSIPPTSESIPAASESIPATESEPAPSTDGTTLPSESTTQPNSIPASDPPEETPVLPMVAGGLFGITIIVAIIIGTRRRKK